MNSKITQDNSDTQLVEAEIIRPIAQGLYDPANEHDACGVGFVAHIKGKKSHAIVTQGLQILEKYLIKNETHNWIKLFTKMNIPCGPIYNIKQAVASNYINEADLAELRQWKNNPSKWNSK